MRALYLVSKCLPRVCMGGSSRISQLSFLIWSAPRVHGWFRQRYRHHRIRNVCPACAWVVPHTRVQVEGTPGLPRVCMGGSSDETAFGDTTQSAPRLHGWFLFYQSSTPRPGVCPAFAWVVPSDSYHERKYPCLPRVCMGGS